MKHWILSAALLCCTASLRAQAVAFVVDNAGGRVQVLELATRRVRASIPAGAESSEMFILPNNRWAFVSNEAGNNVAVIDLLNNARVSVIAAGEGPGSLTATPDGRYLYVANQGSNDVTVIDTSAREAVATIPVEATPVNVNLAANGRFLYVVNQDEEPTGTVSVIDVNRSRVVKTIPVGLLPNQFAFAPALNKAYVVNRGSHNLSVVDLATQEVIGEPIPVGQGPVSVAFSSDGRRLYCLNRDSNSISVVDTSVDRTIREIAVGSQPVAMVVTFDSKFGFVTNQGSNNVTVLDLTLNTAELTIAVGAAPFSLMLDPNEDFLYVTSLGSTSAAGSVSVIDVNTDRLVATIPTGGVPVQFTMLNAPTLLELTANPSPAGSRIVLNGEGFLAGSTVRFTTSAPPRTVTVPGSFFDSQGLQAAIPSFPGSSAVVSVANPDGNSSEEVTLRIGSPSPSITPGGVVEGAGFARAPSPISGGSIVAVFGSFPGVIEQGAPGFPLPRSLGNATVTFNGVPAPLIFVSSGQINLVAPIRLLALERVRVAATVSGQTSVSQVVNLAPSAPGIFVLSADGQGAFVPSVVRRGETGVMFLTGLGNTNPPPIDGEPAPLDVIASTMAPLTVNVGGSAARVLFSGLAPTFSGLYQINFEVPSSIPSAGMATVTVSVGERTSNSVRLAVQ